MKCYLDATNVPSQTGLFYRLEPVERRVDLGIFGILGILGIFGSLGILGSFGSLGRMCLTWS